MGLRDCTRRSEVGPTWFCWMSTCPASTESGYERREGLAAGATDYLTKPFDPIGLADRLATILAAASAAGGGAAGGLDS